MNNKPYSEKEANFRTIPKGKNSMTCFQCGNNPSGEECILVQSITPRRDTICDLFEEDRATSQRFTGDSGAFPDPHNDGFDIAVSDAIAAVRQAEGNYDKALKLLAEKYGETADYWLGGVDEKEFHS